MRRIAWPLLAGIVALAVAWWLARSPARVRLAAAPDAPVANAPIASTPAKPARAPKRRTPSSTPAAQCAPHASARCYQGDVWSLDGCGYLEDKLDECEERLCHDAACDAPDPEPCVDPPEGRCAGNSVRSCIAGQARVIDCAAQGLECVVGEEGAECVPPIPASERCSGPPTCDGEVLVECEAGRKVQTSCSAQRAQCLKLADQPFPSCVRIEPEVPPELGCGPCGCPADPRAREQQCDGRDDDGDGLVDEELECGAVPVLAFIVTDAAGQSSHGEADVEAELARVNAIYARTSVPAPPTFVLESTVWLDDASLLDVDAKEVSSLANDARVHPARDAFYVPIVFTDTLTVGGKTPKSGISTLPNGTCGGMQESTGPDVGIVIVQKGRSPTTVAHELGHFLGLCHTHAQETGAPRLVVGDASRSDLRACEASCRGEGDGICDTPFDPGPEQCTYDATCEARCVVSEEPDARNVMSYYTACRARFSDEQIRLVQNTIALRRGWHACLGERCACQLGASTCPVGMSCRPFDSAANERTFACDLDGPLLPGADCQSTRECGQGSLCFTETSSGRQRCVRPCLTSRPGCTCASAGSDLHVCIEDLRR